MTTAIRQQECRACAGPPQHRPRGSYYYYGTSPKISFGTATRAATPSIMDIVLYRYAPLKPFDDRLIVWDKDANDDSSSSSTGNAFVLATSTAVEEQRPHLIRRILGWLRRTGSQCRDAVWVTLRGSEIVLRLSPLILLAPASVLASYYYNDNNDNNSDNHSNNWIADAAWSYTRAAVTDLGPAFVKLCQWIATRRDLFPVAVCDRLGVLQDSGHAHSWRSTDRALRHAFGDDYAARGLVVEHNGAGAAAQQTLIGCGSAAQVYKGTLRRRVSKNTTTTASSSSTAAAVTENRPVAIKVLHPRLEERIDRDLWFVQTVARLLHDCIPSERLRMLNLPRAVSNFGAILRRQADLTLEAENLTRFRRNFYRHNNDEESSKILFPRPMEGWISKDVLVEDLVDNAQPISEILNDWSEEGIQIRRELAGPLLRAFLKMVFIDNLSHGDLHAGNVLVQTSTVERAAKRSRIQTLLPFMGGCNMTLNDSVQPLMETRRQIVFLDAGIATSLSPNDQRNLLDLFRAVILNDGNRAGRLMVERARYERCSEKPGGVEAFAGGIEALVAEFHDRRKQGLTLGAVRIGSLLSRVLDLCRVHGVEIDPAMASIVISTLVLEGLGRSLDPNLNLIDFAVPFVLGRGRV